MFLVLFGGVALVLLLVYHCLIPFSSHKSCGVFQVSVEGHWTSPGLMSWCSEHLYVSLTWTAGILEICCSLRGKKNATFNPLEVQNGPASRDMRYKIQKWNVNSIKVHPILVANARVDWMSLDDSDITQQLGVARNAAAKAHSVALASRHGQ